MSVTLELTEADEALLRERARAQGVSEVEFLLRLLRDSARDVAEPVSKRFDFPRLNTGGFTEAAMKLDTTKNGWWEELEYGDDPAGR